VLVSVVALLLGDSLNSDDVFKAHRFLILPAMHALHRQAGTQILLETPDDAEL
jgi:hypothetical protein